LRENLKFGKPSPFSRSFSRSVLVFELRVRTATLVERGVLGCVKTEVRKTVPVLPISVDLGRYAWRSRRRSYAARCPDAITRSTERLPPLRDSTARRTSVAVFERNSTRTGRTCPWYERAGFSESRSAATIVAARRVQCSRHRRQVARRRRTALLAVYSTCTRDASWAGRGQTAST
jgi:hypothetical protein